MWESLMVILPPPIRTGTYVLPSLKYRSSTPTYRLTITHPYPPHIYMTIKGWKPHPFQPASMVKKIEGITQLILQKITILGNLDQ